MIKQTLKENLLYISIDNVDFSYRIPIKKMAKTIDWRIGEKGTAGIVIKGVSKWALQLFTKNITDPKYVTQFKNIVQEHCSENTINWDDTFLAVNIQNEYHSLVATNKTTDKILSEDEIISNLKKRFKLN